MRHALRSALALLLALASSAPAQERSIRIHDFDARLAVRADGALEVTERLTLGFTGEWNGVQRDLSLRHRTGRDREERLRLEVGEVTDGAGRPLRVEQDDADGGWTRRLRIWVPGARDARREVVIRYRVENALRFFYAGDEPGALDELYWNVTGNAWDMPIDRVRARVVLPPGALPTQTAAYTGPPGSGESEALVETLGGEVRFTAARALGPYEGMTVAVGWPPGHVTSRPAERTVRAAEAARWWPLLLPFLAFAGALRAWRRRGRDPRPEAVVVRYEPPDALSPAELGTLVDHRAQMRDVTATLVDLAVRGYVGIEEREERRLLGLLSETEFVFHRLRPRADWSALAPHERRYLTGLFQHASPGPSWTEVRGLSPVAAGRGAGAGPDEGGDGAESVRLSDLTHRFYRALPGIRDAVYDALVRRGYYLRRPDRVTLRWRAGALAALAAGVGSALWAADARAGWVEPLALGAAGAASALVLFAFAWVMPARTPAGARAREAALGFREFLGRVEGDRFRRMATSPEAFERFLPHAMAFGVEERWAEAFEEICHEPPAWYGGSGAGPFRTSSFSSRMHTLSRTASSTMSSSPSSSSSGSGGGGSSGGGSGGGGGSGF